MPQRPKEDDWWKPHAPGYSDARRTVGKNYAAQAKVSEAFQKDTGYYAGGKKEIEELYREDKRDAKKTQSMTRASGRRNKGAN